MTSEKERLGYALGLNIAKNLQETGFEEFDYSAFSSALEDHYAKSELKLSVDEVNETLKNAMAKIQGKARASNGRRREILRRKRQS